MKDNYSWLDDCFDNLLDWYGMPKDYLKKPSQEQAYTEAKQTIISQIEIEKLRARKETILHFRKIAQYEKDRGYGCDRIIGETNIMAKNKWQPKEKLKELEK